MTSTRPATAGSKASGRRAVAARHPMAPLPYRVHRVHREASDVVTLDVEPDGDGMADPEPGQFCMLYAYPIGEVPISVSGCPTDDGLLRHTVRAVGSVTRALCAARPGDPIGVRGPYGTGWPTSNIPGADLLVVCGGLGFAPLRPVVRRALSGPGPPRSLRVVVGARQPDDLLFCSELAAWADQGVDVAVTVDAAPPGWAGEVGTVTRLLRRIVNPTTTIACVCGPEVMMRVVARQLLDAGLDPTNVFVSLERNMHCGIGQCGHCQLGPLLICQEGPVRPWSLAAPLLEVRRW